MEERLTTYCELNPNLLTKEQMEKIRLEILNPKKNTISDELLDFQLWCKGLPSRQESFAAYIMEQIPDGSGRKVLEVGGGRVGRLSLLLAEQGFHMTCMDPRLELKDGAGVHAVKAAFDWESADLQGYDYVVAQSPCEATEHVVRACTSQGVPFIMTLCGVPHPFISGGMPEDVYAWYRYLRDIDSRNTELQILKLYHLVSTAVIGSRDFWE